LNQIAGFAPYLFNDVASGLERTSWLVSAYSNRSLEVNTIIGVFRDEKNCILVRKGQNHAG
jgi:hypothetical protein